MREICCIYNGKWHPLSYFHYTGLASLTFTDLFKLEAYMKIEGIIFITSIHAKLKNIYNLPDYGRT